MEKKTIKVIDARMGRGKTTAAINYMADHKNDKRFIYATPYLKEVERICEACDFEQPGEDKSSKLSDLKALMHHGKNISTTHALFYLMDDEALEIAKSMKYTLIIDEALTTISREKLTSGDAKILSQFLTVTEDHVLKWNDPEYSGKFDKIKELAETGALFRLDGAVVNVMDPAIFKAFDEVIMMTYLFEGQYQRGFFDYFGFGYKICGVKEENGRIVFSDEPDMPPKVDYSDLITLIDDDKINDIGKPKNSLSSGWYSRRGGVDNPDIKKLRSNLYSFVIRRAHTSCSQLLWTCPKECRFKVTGKSGRFGSGFISMTARATNEYRDRDAVAYLVNKFADPAFTKFFKERGIYIDEDQYALGEMLQFIWRSAIRDNKHIYLYIPSERMRTLFKNWLVSVSEGGDNA